MTSWLMPFASNPNLRGSYAAVVPVGDPGVDGGEALGAGDDADGDGATGDADGETAPPAAPPLAADAAADDEAGAAAACEGAALESHAARIGSSRTIAARIGNARRRMGRFVIGYALPDLGV